MALSTENKYYTRFVLLVMLLMTLISGLALKNSRISWDPSIAYIFQHLFKTRYFQAEHCYDTSQNRHGRYSGFYLFSSFSQQKYTAGWSFRGIIFRQCLCFCILFVSVYTNLDSIWIFSSTFQIYLQSCNENYYNLTFLQQFFKTCYFF